MPQISSFKQSFHKSFPKVKRSPSSSLGHLPKQGLQARNPVPSRRYVGTGTWVKTYLLIIITAISLFLISLGFNSYYRLRTIQLEGIFPKNNVLGIENLKGLNLYFLSEDFITDTVNNNNPNIVVAEVIKEFPDKLIIKLRLNEPIAQLKLNAGYAQLSEEGKILKKSKTPFSGVKQKNTIPTINFYQQFDYYQIKPGNKLDYEEIEITLALLKKSQDLNLKVENIDISGLNMIVFNLKDQTADGQLKKILLTAEKDREKQEFELETIIKQFKIGAKDFKVLDLRFDKPIVKF